MRSPSGSSARTPTRTTPCRRPGCAWPGPGAGARGGGGDEPGSPGPEDVAPLADHVGLALYVVMDALTPAERVSFVLHDVFEVPFDAIAAILGRSTGATKMLASRARGRIRLGPQAPGGDSAAREVVDAFLAAAGRGD